MLDFARCAARMGDQESAIKSCRAVCADFERIVVSWEQEAENVAPFDEHRLALGSVVQAVDVLEGLDASDDAAVALRARAIVLLERSEADAAIASDFSPVRADPCQRPRTNRRLEVALLGPFFVICVALGWLVREYVRRVLEYGVHTANWAGGMTCCVLIAAGIAARIWLLRRRESGSQTRAPSKTGESRS